MTDRRRAARIVAEWRHRRETGAEESPADLLRAHPDLADELRVQMTIQQRLEGVAPGQAPPSLGPPTPLRERIGDFRILREIGRGGMGVVYEAEQISMRRPVALKVLFPGVTLDPKAVTRFRREAQAAGRLHHTNIVAVYAMGEEDGVFFYAMERIEGRTLAAVITDLKRLGGRPPAAPAASDPSSWVATGSTGRAFYARAAAAFAGLADALEHAHAVGIVHRDVKPSNVMLDAEGVLKLTDFGLARVEEGGAALTLTGDVLGTPAYMSPEQIRPGTEPLDARTDIYSLGATLYEFLCLRPPHQGATPQDLFARILTEDPPPARRWNPRIPKDLDTIVSKATERDPARRYRTAADFAHDLRLFAEGAGIRARRTGPLGRAWRAVKKSPIRSGLIATVLILAAAALLLAAQHRRDQARREEAEYARLLAEASEVQRRSWAPLYSVMELDPSHGGTPAARRLLESAVALAPSRPEAYYELALLEGDPQERLVELERARERGLSGRIYRLTRATIEQRAGRDAQAQEDLAIAHGMPDGGGWRDAWMEGRMHLREGRFEEAIRCLTLALERERAVGAFEPTTLKYRAEAREESGDLGGALVDLATFRDETSSSGPYVDVRIASLWRRLGKEDLAESGFLRALASALKDGSGAAWLGLCAACAAQGEVEWLERAAGPALAAHPGEANIMRLRANGLLSAQRLVEAEHWANEALRIEPDSVRSHHLLGAILGARGLPTEALAEARRARALDASDLAAATLEATALFAGGSRAEALVLLRGIVKGHPYDHEAHNRLGDALFKAGQFAEALPIVERAIQILPSCPHCRYLLAQVLQSLGRFDAALLAIEEAISISPQQAPLHGMRGLILVSKGRLEDALLAFDRATALEPDDERDRYNHASTLLQLHRAPEAVDELAAGVRRHPAAVEWQVLLAQAYTASGRAADALTALDEARKLNPEASALHGANGDVLHALGRLPDAVLAWKRCAALDPTNVEARSALASVLATTDDAALRDPKAALAWAREAVAIDGRNGNAQNALGLALSATGQLEEGLLAWEKSAALMPDDDLPSRNRVVSLIKIGRIGRALAEATAGVERKPGSVTWRLLLGEAHVASGHLAPALAEFGKAIELEPENPAPYLDRGNAYQSFGRMRDALADWQRAADLNPADAPTRYNLATTLIIAADPKLRDPERAVRLLQEAIAIDGGNAEYANMLGGALAQAGRPDEALSVWEKILAELHGGPGVEHNRVDLLLRLGRNTVALTEAVTGVQHYPADAYSRWQLGRAYVASGQPALAVAPLDKAIELDPKQSSYHCTRGDVLHSLGKTPDALRDWQSGASLDPRNAAVRNTMAWILATSADAKLRDAPRAVVLAKEAVHVNDRAAEAWNTLGVALGRNGQWQESIAALEESAKRSEGGTAFDWFFASIAHKRLGDDTKAKDCFDRATTWEAGHAEDLSTGDLEELSRFRREAEEALGIPASGTVPPPPKK